MLDFDAYCEICFCVQLPSKEYMELLKELADIQENYDLIIEWLSISDSDSTTFYAGWAVCVCVCVVV